MGWFEKRRAKKRIARDAQMAKNKGRAEGYEMGVAHHLDGMNALKTRLDTMTREFVQLEKKTNATYQRRIDELNADYERKLDEIRDEQAARCNVCKRGVEAEKDKVIHLQQELTTRIQSFQEIERKMFTFLSLVEGSFEGIIRSAGRLTDSLTQLQLISQEANNFLENSKDLIELIPEKL